MEQKQWKPTIKFSSVSYSHSDKSTSLFELHHTLLPDATGFFNIYFFNLNVFMTLLIKFCCLFNMDSAQCSAIPEIDTS